MSGCHEVDGFYRAKQGATRGGGWRSGMDMQVLGDGEYLGLGRFMPGTDAWWWGEGRTWGTCMMSGLILKIHGLTITIRKRSERPPVAPLFDRTR